MTELVLKGGYGEHGRSCFLLEPNDEHFVMFDCGILDTDAIPYPNISPSEAQCIDYLFLSHAHKDHTGAVPHLIQMGFQGTIVASPETFSQIGLHYDKVQELDFSSKRSADLKASG